MRRTIPHKATKRRRSAAKSTLLTTGHETTLLTMGHGTTQPVSDNINQADGSAVVLSDEEGISDQPNRHGKSKLTFVKYNATANPEWRAFNRSREADSGRRHYAECRYCKIIISGRLPVMREHVRVCELMDDAVKKLIPVEKEKRPEPAIASKTISELFRNNPTHQEDCDKLLALFVITNDIPFR